jgi:hypothetical protein
MIKIDTLAGTICGTLIWANGQTFAVQSAGKASPKQISFSVTRNAQIVASC